LNDKFAKAHIRAQQCYLVVGEIEKARQAAIKCVELGDSSTASKIPFMEELLKYESYAFKAKEKMEWREALYYLSKILEYATDSIRHLSLKIECLISENPADMTNAIRFTTSLQEQFIDNAEFLFWRGRILLYNGQTDMGKKHLKQALNIDPDNKTYVKYWKGI
jgi:tetratricopeptide (TPR) repeat protein